MKITKRQLRRIIREESKSTIKHNANPALKGDQTKLPDALQKGIIDKEESEQEKSSNEGTVKITRKQLKKILTEEPHDWYKDMQAGSITYADYKQMVKDWEAQQRGGPSYLDGGYRSSTRKTTYVGADANAEQIKAVEALNPREGTFLGSILSQLKKGRGLSPKQKTVVRKIMRKRDPESEKLFEGNMMKINKRQLRRIIREEKARLAEYGDYPRTGDRVPPGKGNPSKALEEIYAGIDKLIYAIGNEKAYLELVGIVEEWE